MLKALKLFAVLLILAGVSAVSAQESENNAAADHEIEHEAAHEYHKNVAAVFVGVTHLGRRNNRLALGIEYERRLNAAFGIGVLAEQTAGEDEFWVYAIPFAYHTGRWKFYAAPGIEDSKHGSESLLRLGGEYGFEVNGWEISPQLDIDVVDGDSVLVIGVTFGKGF